MSAPPMGIINNTPKDRDIATIIQNNNFDSVEENKPIKIMIEIAINKFSKCWPENVIGAPLIIPWSLEKAIIEPVNVIAPIVTPMAISIKLDKNMFPLTPIP